MERDERPVDRSKFEFKRGPVGPALAAHWLVALGLLAIFAAIAAGPVRSLVGPRARRAVQAGAALPALIAWLALRPSGGARATLVEPSISLWLALLTAIAAALFWRRLERPGSQNTSAMPAASPNVV